MWCTLQNDTSTLRTSELASSSGDPCDSRNQHDDADSGAGVVHVLAVHWGESRKVEGGGCEQEEEKAGNVEEEADSFAKRPRTAHLHVASSETGKNANEQSNGVGEVCELLAGAVNMSERLDVQKPSVAIDTTVLNPVKEPK